MAHKITAYQCAYCRTINAEDFDTCMRCGYVHSWKNFCGKYGRTRREDMEL